MTDLPGMEDTKNEALSGSIYRLRELSEGLKLMKENIELAKEKVVIEMEKAGKIGDGTLGGRVLDRHQPLVSSGPTASFGSTPVVDRWRGLITDFMRYAPSSVKTRGHW